MRNLAEICTIKSVETIVYKEQTYDKVKKYSLNENEYEFVAANGFNVGDKVVVIGEGALIPAMNKDFEFLKTKCYNAKFDAFRVKPVRMCGFISMGLLMPMGILPKKNYKVGQDVTDVLKLRKYEDAEDASPTKKYKNPIKAFLFKHFPKIARFFWKGTKAGGSFPVHLIEKTDETNIEHNCDELKSRLDKPYYVTIKMEGQSGTFYVENKKLVCCSRNLAYFEKFENNYWHVAENLGLERIIKDWNEKHNQNIIIQGEICGPGIQDNIYKFKTLKLFIFNVKDILTKHVFTFEELRAFVEETGLQLVPLLEFGDKLSKFVTPETLNEVRENIVEKMSFTVNEEDQTISIEKFDGKINNKNRFHCEGIVIRTQNQDYSCKFKSKEYALWFSGKETA